MWRRGAQAADKRRRKREEWWYYETFRAEIYPAEVGSGEKNTDLSDAGLIAREADLRAVLPFDETVLVRGHETHHLVEEILLLNFHREISPFVYLVFIFSFF